ncbi:hypothetical protein SAMN04488128_108177 [Chitinophaga eiseniae]|uniref:Uncharacterized protein n=1 Tax=Chitinophaga eiseniae TaxID=634771 RepID=A0A1T4U4B1_9BACT|nr:hypothetical protein [Chitinophaga eiseniae]SKA47368.1 hypothetical protein SAMN04488128_108177 [Chitinophaga eiseniae]
MYEIIPFKRVGQFEFNTSISRYLDGDNFNFYPKGDGESWDTYSYRGGGIDIYTSDSIIESISCRSDCFLEGQMLIGMNIEDFWAVFKIAVSNIKMEKVYFFDGSEQDVYDVDCLGLQLWVDQYNTIVTVFVSI